MKEIEKNDEKLYRVLLLFFVLRLEQYEYRIYFCAWFIVPFITFKHRKQHEKI